MYIYTVKLKKKKKICDSHYTIQNQGRGRGKDVILRVETALARRMQYINIYNHKIMFDISNDENKLI